MMEEERQPEVLYEDTEVAVLNKPAGIAVHSTPAKPSERTLVDFILECWPEIKGVGDPSTVSTPRYTRGRPEEFERATGSPQAGSGQAILRPGIVHRLDKETSGVILIAKTQEAFYYLKKQFQERKVEKTYLALVSGKMPEAEGEISLPIGRSRKFGKFTTRTAKSKIRQALTRWEIVQEYRSPQSETFTLLEVKPETGRTHQIRVHLAAIGHPVVGDPLYGGKIARKIRPELGRMFLHAKSLKLLLPSDRILLAEADLPEDLDTFLKNLVRLEAATQA